MTVTTDTDHVTFEFGELPGLLCELERAAAAETLLERIEGLRAMADSRAEAEADAGVEAEAAADREGGR